MPPSIIPNGANLNDQIRPTDNAFFDGSWHSTPLIPFYNRYDPQLVGKTIKIILPISINGIENEYSFVFSLDWIYEYPELQKNKL